MEITSLLKKLKGSPPEEPEQFFAVQIDSEFVKTAIWTVKNNTTEIVAVGNLTEWDGTSNEILLEAIDNSLAVALEKLTGKNEPNKVIFGLTETWVTPEGIAKPRLADLKKICNSLSLEPLGFVITTEAITHYLKEKEGTPLSAILLRASPSEVAVSIVTLGEVEGTHVAGRSGDLAADVREGLTRFGHRESLPSRILLYNGGENLNDLVQQLQTYDWQSVFPFLHLPKIESVSDDFSITAIAVSGGAEVAKSLGFTISPPEPTSPATQEEYPDAPEELGPIEQTEESPQITEESAVPEEFPQEPEETAVAEIAQRPQRRLFESLAIIPLKISRVVANIKENMFKGKPHVKLSNAFFPKPILVTAVFVIGIIAVLTLAAGVFARKFPRATVVLTLTGQTLNQRLSINIDPQAKSVDPAQHTLPAEKIAVTKSGEKTKETSGKKTIGDKSQGEVVVYNKTNATKKFTAGTTLSSSSGKQFTLDSDITVASQSAQTTATGMNITFGTATAKITAAAIGPEYNLEAGDEFKIDNLSPSAFSAKNESALTGGTKKETQAVSKKDRSDLRDELLDELKSQAAAEIQSKSTDIRVFAETITLNPTEENFSADAGEESTSIKLSMTAEASALAIKDSDYQDLLASMLAENVPDGFSLVSDGMETTVENVNSEEEKLTFDAVVIAKLKPRISEEEIVNKIAGKRPAAAAKALSDVPYFKKVEITFSPILPNIIRWIPTTRSHINIEVKLEE